jgi:hypothetical protein
VSYVPHQAGVADVLRRRVQSLCGGGSSRGGGGEVVVGVGAGGGGGGGRVGYGHGPWFGPCSGMSGGRWRCDGAVGTSEGHCASWVGESESEGTLRVLFVADAHRSTWG